MEKRASPRARTAASTVWLRTRATTSGRSPVCSLTGAGMSAGPYGNRAGIEYAILPKLRRQKDTKEHESSEGFLDIRALRAFVVSLSWLGKRAGRILRLTGRRTDSCHERCV